MTTIKKLGIWMDHSNARFIDYTPGFTKTNTSLSKLISGKEHGQQESEKVRQHKEQGEESAYYKELGAVIKNYDDVILFGPTNAKLELLNMLKADRSFEKIKIETKDADKMTDNQQHAFVKEYFSAL